MTNWGPIGREVYERTYSRKMEDGTNETWDDTVKRVVRGNTSLVDKKHIEDGERERLTELIGDFDLMPAGRHLWVSGVEGRQFLNNCHRAGWTENAADHFGFVFNELMKGGGIGANYSDYYLKRMKMHGPDFELKIHCGEFHQDYDEINADPTTGVDTIFRYGDSREGWVAALRDLIEAHQFGTASDPMCIDVTNIRQRGAEIRGFGGTASGPGPLADMLRSVHDVLRNRADRSSINWQEAMEIDHHISRCVIAGNVRRSARMSMKLWSDPDILDFINLKADTGEHWTTNISVELDRSWFAWGHETTLGMAVKRAIAEAAFDNGEPGLYNSVLSSIGETGDVRCTNPCGEITLEEWENCNLGHVNLAHVDGDFQEVFRLMTRFLIRATFADIEDPLQREVMDRNRRIGVGIFGFQEWCVKQGVKYSGSHLEPAIAIQLSQMRKIVENEAKSYANELGIPIPIKCTTVAPTGSIAKLPGVSEGIHPIYAKWFKRRVRYADSDTSLATLDPAIELEACIYSDNTTVATFICADEIFLNVPLDKHHLIESAEDIEMNDMLRVQAMVQEYYADNAVSFTVNFDPDSQSYVTVGNSMFDAIRQLKGTTVMPDGSRPQAPYERISESEYDAAAFSQYDAAMDDCATGACPVR